MKRCSTSLVGEKQIKITLRIHLASVRMAIIKNKRENSGGEEGEGTCIPGRNENWCTLRKSAWRFKKKQTETQNWHPCAGQYYSQVTELP